MHTTSEQSALDDKAGLDGPAWDLASQYPSISSAAYRASLAESEAELAGLEARGASLGQYVELARGLEPERDADLLGELRRFAIAADSTRARLDDLAVYARCVLSTDAANVEASRARGFLESLAARLDAAEASSSLILAFASDAFSEAFCASPETVRFRFALGQRRKDRARALPLPAERALATMSAPGLHAWGTLYDTIAGTLRCRVRTPSGAESSVGLAVATSYLKRPEPELRESAWRGVNAALKVHGDTLAAILNAISGWRGSEGGLRAHTEPARFLDSALRQSRLCRATLDALMGAIRGSREVGRRALRAQAAFYGVDRLGPWDILAPAPVAPDSSPGIPFAHGLELVRDAYASVDPVMGRFVERMANSGRIEGRAMDGKKPGAYCTRFPQSRDPFVYMTYRGASADVSTLAHELGHAYHSELLRDIPLAESKYPMTLAETASTFAEAALGERLACAASGGPAALELAWADAQDAATFLVNIPARFEFESRLYERRPRGPLGPDELCSLMRESWAEWYGDSLSGYDAWYWASKLHFHKTGTHFYNFPYSFGYLFSLGLFARREVLGDRFHEAYASLLRDTGRMEVEELAWKHLGVDLTEQGFWLASLAVVEKKVVRLERLADTVA